jgi:hypothetical protein
LSGVLFGWPVATASARERSNRVREGEDRPMVGREIGLSQFMELAQDAFDQFLGSRQFAQMTADGKMPNIVLGVPENNTDRWDLDVRQIFTMVNDQLTNTGALAIYEAVTPEAEYILSSEFYNSEVPGGSHGSEYSYRFRLTLTSVSGRAMGGWSAYITYVQ